MKKSKLTLRALTEGAILIAAAQVLSYLKLWRMPWGGSITLAMVPIILYAVRWGLGPGLLAGFVYGVMQFMFDGGIALGWQSIIGDYLSSPPSFGDSPHRPRAVLVNHHDLHSAAVLGRQLRHRTHLPLGRGGSGAERGHHQPTLAYRRRLVVRRCGVNLVLEVTDGGKTCRRDPHRPLAARMLVRLHVEVFPVRPEHADMHPRHVGGHPAQQGDEVPALPRLP